MGLSSGTHLGAYEIRALIGLVGMGNGPERRHERRRQTGGLRVSRDLTGDHLPLSRDATATR
jgi:hypothetical protein